MAMSKFFMDEIVGPNFKNLTKPTLEANKAINGWISGADASVSPAVMHAKGALGGIAASYHNIKNAKMGFKEGIQAAHKGENGNYSPAAIAGSFIAAGVGYRALSGGGIYKDQNGNTNLAGIPFI